VTFRFDPAKAVAVITYLASRAENVPGFDKYKAGKLIYLADKYHLVRYGRPILGDEYRALEFGPIPQQTIDFLHALEQDNAQWVDAAHFERLKQILEIDRAPRYPRFVAAGAPDLASLTRSEIIALDHIIALHGKKSFDELLALTHATAAYRKAWEMRGKDKAAPMRYEDFFEEDSDALAGAFEEMIENDALGKAFPTPPGF
jgi:uncharacterized phage-associated protein